MSELVQEHQTELILIALYLLSGILTFLTRTKTPEQWVELGETNPRLAAFVKLIRAVGLDPVKMLVSLQTLILSKASDEIKKLEQPKDTAKKE